MAKVGKKGKNEKCKECTHLKKGEIIKMGTEKWRKYAVDKILEAIKGSGWNISLVCKRLKCDRRTFLRAMDEHPEIKDALKDAEEEFGDLVESQMQQLIKEGNTTMIIFYAKTKMKDRGYVEEQIIHNGENVPMIIDDIPAIEAEVVNKDASDEGAKGEDAGKEG